MIKKLRNFGLALGILSLIVGARLSFKFHNFNFMYLAIAGLFFAAAGLFIPLVLKPIYAVFNKVASIVIDLIFTRFILIIFFYLVFAPTGILSRLMRKDLLGLKLDKKAASYWIKRAKAAVEPAQYEKQF